VSVVRFDTVLRIRTGSTCFFGDADCPCGNAPVATTSISDNRTVRFDIDMTPSSVAHLNSNPKASPAL
jgi:hypothetical protein